MGCPYHFRDKAPVSPRDKPPPLNATRLTHEGHHSTFAEWKTKPSFASQYFSAFSAFSPPQKLTPHDARESTHAAAVG